MKKAFVGIVILVLGLGVPSGFVRAETINPGARSLGAAEAAAIQTQINVLRSAIERIQTQIILKRVLDILTALVPEVKSKLVDPTLAHYERAMIGANLAGISKHLLAVRGALNAPLSQMPIAAALPKLKVSMQPPSVAKQFEGMQKPKESAEAAVSEPSKPAEPAAMAKEETAPAPQEKQTASLWEKFRGYAPIIVVVVLVGIAFALWRRKEEKPAPAVPQV